MKLIQPATHQYNYEEDRIEKHLKTKAVSFWTLTQAKKFHIGPKNIGTAQPPLGIAFPTIEGVLSPSLIMVVPTKAFILLSIVCGC